MLSTEPFDGKVCVDMEDKNYKTPPIVWLKVTDFVHAWLQHEMRGKARVGEQYVICVQHLPEAKSIFKEETVEDPTEASKVDKSMSAARMGFIRPAIAIDEPAIEHDYGITTDALQFFTPIECPTMRMTDQGVLRPWTQRTNLSRRQANELIQALRSAFWRAVEEFNDAYAKNIGKKYPAIEMIEAFCKSTNISDYHAETIKREWNRRVKREKDRNA